MNVIFDIDDTLNNLYKHSYELLNINKPRYNTLDSKCDNLTNKEIEDLHKIYRAGDTYLTCRAHRGITRINGLIKNGLDTYIHSYCCGQEAANAKRIWVKRHINIPDNHFIMEIDNKTPLRHHDIIVEDNLEYLARCNATYKILINKQHNQDKYYNIDSKKFGIIRVSSLNSALDFIEELMKNGENAY